MSTPLQNSRYYHMYNRGINSCEIFPETKDYERFLHLYDKYVDPVADTFAWALMGNHFHVVVRVRDEKDIKTLYEISHCRGLQPPTGHPESPTVVTEPVGGDNWITRKPNISNQFSHLFNSYAQYFNTKYKRHGALFERSFKRLEITNEAYLKQLIMYVHNNPVHHGFCEHTVEYPWTSYLSHISKKPTKINRDYVLDLFGDKENFRACTCLSLFFLFFQ